MRILGIETSCDDTGIAVLEVTGKKNPPRFSILSNIVSSQIQIHEKYGGVYPMLAKREHEKNLPIVLKKALKEARVEKTDAIAITYGPGLSPCLWTGINFAKDLARKWKVPLIPVDHIEGHLLIALLSVKNGQFSIFNDQIFPAVGLIVSGGHTQLVLVKNIGDYKIIGETRDDASGEAFDKTARILGLGFPGGPEIAAAAAKFSISNSQFSIKLPRPMMNTKDYDFSFSGLKTAVLYDYQSRSEKVRKSKEYVQEMAAEIQQAIVDVLISKTLKAAKEYKVKSIILGGGVAANDELRKQLHYKLKTINYKLILLAPAKNLSTDNGAMIAVAGYFNWLKRKYTKNPETLQAQPNLRIQ
jgi:N6-L-threonylcarbamoyladenine synthase